MGWPSASSSSVDAVFLKKEVAYTARYPGDISRLLEALKTTSPSALTTSMPTCQKEMQVLANIEANMHTLLSLLAQLSRYVAHVAELILKCNVEALVLGL